MEAVPRLPMLGFELKVSEEKASFYPTLKDYIQYNYNEDGEAFSAQLNQLDGLRASAVRPTIDVSGCATLKKYYCQLHFLMNRFPMSKGGKAAVKFTWRDIYSALIVSAADITVELAAVLYNIGALHSQLGASGDRTNPDTLRMACTHFQCAAWAFQHIIEEFPQMLSYDPSCELLSFMNLVCLAQAQECILEKGMLDNRKANIISKIAAQVVEFYEQAMKKLSSRTTYDDLTIAETIGNKRKKKWMSYLKFKISFYTCITWLYQGQQAEEEQKMGERVAYYQAALNKLEEAAKLNKGLDASDRIADTLTFTQDVVVGKRKIAKNENEFIYHEDVPQPNTLEKVKGAVLVKGIGFSVTDSEISGGDIFSRLVPLAAHEASSVYSEKLAQLLRSVTADVMCAEAQLDEAVASIQISDNWKAQCGGLPQELIDRCAAMSAMPDAIENLMDAMKSLAETDREVDGMLDQIDALLNKEREETKGYEDVVGKRPPSIAATDLTREAKKYADAHEKASESNVTLNKAIDMHIANLRLVMLPIRQLQAKLPPVEIDSAQDEAVFKKMDMLMAKIAEMKQQRGVLVAQLREAINRDDITAKIVTYSGENKIELFEKEMAKHQPQVNLIKQNLAAQANILGAVEETYAEYGVARRNLNAKCQQRDEMVGGLIASFDAYHDLIAKANKGLEFYNKLHGNVAKLLQRVRSTCKVQEEERQQVLSTILEDVPKKNNNEELPARIYNDINSGLKLKDYLNMKKETGQMSLAGGNNYFGVRPTPLGSEGTDISAAQSVDAFPQQYPSTTAWQTAPSSYVPYQPNQPSYPYGSAPQETTAPPLPFTPSSSSSTYYTVPSTPESFPTIVSPPPNPVYTTYNPLPQNTFYPNTSYQPSSQSAFYPSAAPTTNQTLPYLQDNFPYNAQPICSPTQSAVANIDACSKIFENATDFTAAPKSSLLGDLPGFTQHVPAYVQPSQPTPPVVPFQQPPVVPFPPAPISTASYSQVGVKREPSNVDLLAGLDCIISQPPLQPLTAQSASSHENKIVIEEEKKAVEVRLDPHVEKTLPTSYTEEPKAKEVVKKKLDKEALTEEINKLEKLLSGMSISGPAPLDLKLKEISDAQEREIGYRNISVARCYPMKNRFPDILPYDENRIELPSTKDDYINASLIKGLSEALPPLILTQSPLPVTFADFWTMILEHNIELIVCLLGNAEINSHIYWPEDKGRVLQFGRVAVALQSSNDRKGWIQRIFTVSGGSNKSRVVVHLQLTSWPPSSMPESPASVVAFVQQVLSLINQQRSPNRPVVVHCLSGVGRSGLFAAALTVAAQLERGLNIPDIVSLVTTLNQGRKNALRDRQHLKFLYETVVLMGRELVQNEVGKTTESDSSPVALPVNASKESKSADPDPLSLLDPLWSLKK